MSHSNSAAIFQDGPYVSQAALRASLGWVLKPEGLCRDAVCVPVEDPAKLRSKENPDLLDIVAVAELIDRPAAIDAESGLVAIGLERSRRQRALHDLQAPDFTLSDLDGKPRSLSDYSKQKRLLFAFSSW